MFKYPDQEGQSNSRFKLQENTLQSNSSSKKTSSSLIQDPVQFKFQQNKEYGKYASCASCKLLVTLRVAS